MEDAVLLGLLCFGGFVLVVGGIGYLLGRAATTGGAIKPLAGFKRHCPRCDSVLDRPICGVCGAPAAPPLARPRIKLALDQLRERVEQLARAGALDESALGALLKAIGSERERVVVAEEAAAAQQRAARARADQTRPVERPALGPVAVEPVTSEPVTVEVVEESAPRRAAPPPLPVTERAAAFEQRKQDWTPPAPPRPAAPKRTWTDWLGAFMEERNMRWGELVGGLLIIGSSLALVVSFWSEIAERPWLKFFLFNGVTAGLFGLGFYSDRRWRLKNTTAGVLLIASLLVPLNFLAIAALGRAGDELNVATLAGEALSATLFATLLYSAGKTLLERGAAWFVVGLMGPALSQLLVRRFVDPQTSQLALSSLAALPAACYLAVNGLALFAARRDEEVSERRVVDLFQLLGLTTFAVALPLGLLLAKTRQPLDTLRQLPLLATVLALGPLSVGLFLWQRLADRGLAALRTVATAIAVAGAVLSASSIVFAWPAPGSLVLAAVANFAIFSIVAWRYELPAAHLVGALGAAAAWIIGVYLTTGELAWSTGDAAAVRDRLLSGDTGWWLMFPVLAYAAMALAAGLARGEQARWLAIAAGALMAISLALVTWSAYWLLESIGAEVVYLVYAVGCLALAERYSRRDVAALGAVLLLAGLVPLIDARVALPARLSPWALKLLAYATVCVVGAALLGARRRASSAAVWALNRGALLGSLAGAAVLAYRLTSLSPVDEAWQWLWVAGIWLALAVAASWLPLVALFQAALTAAVVFAAVSLVGRQPWFAQIRYPWLDPRTLMAIGMGVALLNLGFTAVKLALGARRAAPPWLASGYFSVDRHTTSVLVLLVLGLALGATAAGIVAELSPQTPVANSTPLALHDYFPWRDISFAPVAGGQAWLLLALVLLLLVAIARAARSPDWLLTAVVAGWVACPLVALRFEPQTAVATSLAWLSSAYLLLGAAPIWARSWLGPLLTRFGWTVSRAGRPVHRDATGLLFFVGAGPLFAMALFAVRAAAVAAGGVATQATWPLAIAAATVALVGGFEMARRQAWLDEAPEQRWSELVFLLGASALYGLLIDAVATVLLQAPLNGPGAGSVFSRLGGAVSYSVPLALVAAACLGFAIRQQSARFALVSSLFVHAGATVAFLLATSHPARALDSADWIRLAQVNAAIAAVYSLVWIAARKRLLPATRELAFRVQTTIAPAVVALVYGWAWWALFSEPTGPPNLTQVMRPELADGLALAALALALVSVFASLGFDRKRLSPGHWSLIGVLAAIVVATWSSRWDTGNWLSLKTLTVGHGALATALCALVWRSLRREGDQAVDDGAPAGPARLSAAWPVLQAFVLLALAWRLLENSTAWSVGVGFYLSLALLPALAWSLAQRRYLYAAALITCVAGIVGWGEWRSFDTLQQVGAVLICLLTLPVPYWALIELRRVAPRQLWAWTPGVHRVVSWLALALLVALAAYDLNLDALQRPAVALDLRLDWVALALTLVAWCVCLWDARAREAVAALYLTGLAAAGLLLGAFDLPPHRLLWLGCAVLAAYALATSYLWSRRAGLKLMAQRLRMPDRQSGEFAGQAWLVPVNLLLGTIVLALATLVELFEREWALRVLVAQAAAVQVASVALLARGDHRGWLQRVALWIGAGAAVLFSWAWLVPGDSLTPLNALVASGAALALLAVLYGFGLAKLLPVASDWLVPAFKTMVPLAALVAASLATVLGLEVFEFADRGVVNMAPPAIAVVAVTLAGLVVAMIAAAVLPGRDPLGFSERGRTVYVYGAETILALLFLHIRLTLSWLFSGFFQQWWPLVVMGIAFVGVGLAEFFRRQKQYVLSEPIENTGALLPLLPVLGYWASASSVDYSLLLLTVGMLYAGLSIARRSFGFGVLAAMAVNGGLWFFLHRQQGWGFLAHPQVWLIPPAGCVLVAAYLNRRQLNDAQMTAIRYGTAITIYASSTADIFLNGVAQAPWLPLVLAGLSLVGIFAGILLRVRAFLFLGTAFLSLALFTIVWHAAVDLGNTWLWYACTMVAGVLILALFAVFEKKRNETLEMLGRLRQWEQ